MNTIWKIPPQPNARFTSSSQFSFQRHLQEGGYGNVYLANERSTNTLYAIKIIDMGKIHPDHRVNIETEIALHSQLKSSYIVELFGYFVEGQKLHLVLEYVARGDLQRYTIKRSLTNYQMRKVVRQVALGLEYLHKQGIMLRDLKPENVLLTPDMNVKICDFGWATQVLDNDYCRECGGTLTYLAPESLRKELQNLPVDIWCLGIFVYELLHGDEPYQGKTEREIMDAIQSKKIEFKDGLAKEDVDFVKNMLKFNPEERVTIEDVVMSKFFTPLFEMGYKDLDAPKDEEAEAANTHKFAKTDPQLSHQLGQLAQKIGRKTVGVEEHKKQNVEIKMPVVELPPMPIVPEQQAQPVQAEVVIKKSMRVVYSSKNVILPPPTQPVLAPEPEKVEPNKASNGIKVVSRSSKRPEMLPTEFPQTAAQIPPEFLRTMPVKLTEKSQEMMQIMAKKAEAIKERVVIKERVLVKLALEANNTTTAPERIVRMVSEGDRKVVDVARQEESEDISPTKRHRRMIDLSTVPKEALTFKKLGTTDFGKIVRETPQAFAHHRFSTLTLSKHSENESIAPVSYAQLGDKVEKVIFGRDPRAVLIDNTVQVSNASPKQQLGAKLPQNGTR